MPQYPQTEDNIQRLRDWVKTIREDTIPFVIICQIHSVFFSILHCLASLYSDERAYFGGHWYLADYWNGYEIVKLTSERNFVWDQSEWQRFVTEKNPDLKDFASLSLDRFPIRAIYEAMVKENWVYEQSTMRWAQWRSEKQAKLSSDELHKNIVEELYQSNREIFLEGCRGIEYLIDMLEEHAFQKIQESR